MMKPKYLGKSIGKVIIAVLCCVQVSKAYVQFIPNEELAGTAEYIVLVRMQNVSHTGKTVQWRDVKATVIKNELKVMESIKGSLKQGEVFIINTLKFDGWMEDNVELPPKRSKVLLFLKRNKESELKPVNGIQGVWPMNDGQPTGAGHGTTLEQIGELVEKQANSCSSKAFIDLVDTAEIQTEAGQYKESLEAYRKAYGICPMKDLEEQMAWLMGEVGDEKNNKNWRL